MFGNLFKPKSHYVFDYKPRYYSERKERLQKLEDKYHSKLENSNQEIASIRLSKSGLRNEWKKNKKFTNNNGTNMRLAIIIAILVGIVAYFFELHKLF